MSLPPPTPRALSFPGHIRLRWVNAYIPGGFVFGSIYLPADDPLGAVGSEILGRVGEGLHSLGPPFVLGGNWNATPEVLQDMGWPSILRGRIVRPDSCTCKSTAKKWRTIDHFVMSAGLAANVLSCEISRKASVKPHWPVVVKFKGRPLDEKINILRLPRLFPTELVVGP
eukprot:6249150-Pyramimonas_sp.AAC.1